MDVSHKLLLLAMLGTIVWLVMVVVRLIRQGIAAAQTGLRWRDIDEVTAAEGKRVLSLPFSVASVGSVVRRFVGIAWNRKTSPRKASLSLTEAIVADPIDGTIFQPGEAVIRCACGAAYHAHSWQWLAANNGGKCVSCKQAS